MHATEIRGRLVCPAGSGEVTGSVTDLILDLGQRRVLAIIVLRQQNQTRYVLGVEDVQAVHDVVETLADSVLIPLEATQQYEGLPVFSGMLEEKALTESGKVVGRLTDLEIDDRSWNITAYDVVEGALQTLDLDSHRLPADRVMSAGAHMLLVADTVTD
jgi:uncharacterized protein YrrD